MNNDFRSFPVRSFGLGTQRRQPKGWGGDFAELLSPPSQGMEGVAVATTTVYRWGSETTAYTIEWSDGTVSSGLLCDHDFYPTNRGW